MDHCNDYPTLVSGLARRAMAKAVDARPHRPRAGEASWSMLALMPAAGVLLGQGGGGDSAAIAGLGAMFAQAAGADRPRFTDGLGHSRAVYHPLALHLYLAAGGTGEAAWAAGGQGRGGEPDMALALWWALCRWELGDPDPEAVDAAIGGGPAGGAAPAGGGGPAGGEDPAGAEPAEDATPAPLHPLGVNDQLDAWTYRELTGLHALHRLAGLARRADWRARAAGAAAYHQGHTQPDYTTYQPWGLAAFLGSAATTLFADQQLHDTATHLAVEGGPGAALPALLLADAAAELGTPGGEGK